jgi:hypothetical protein
LTQLSFQRRFQEDSLKAVIFKQQITNIHQNYLERFKETERRRREGGREVREQRAGERKKDRDRDS